MGYTKEELKYIFTKEPELEPVFCDFDTIVFSFLQKYDVKVAPCYDYRYYNQTAVQAWIKWKQWALDHKEFEDYKKFYLDSIEYSNQNTIEKLCDLENIKKCDALLKSWRSKKGKNRKIKKTIDPNLEGFIDLSETRDIDEDRAKDTLEHESFGEWYEKYEKRYLKKYRKIYPITENNKRINYIDSQKRKETKIEQYIEQYQLEKAISQLDDKEQEILKMHYSLDGEEALTLEDIGQKVNMSVEIVSEIIEQAIIKLRYIMYQS